MSGPRLVPVQRCTNLRQWKRMRQLHGSYRVPAPRREPSRAGLLVASVLSILAALLAFYFLIEATLPGGVGR